MNSTHHSFFSSLTSKGNLFLLFLLIVFTLSTLAGIGLLAVNMYELIWPDQIIFSAGVAISAILTIIISLRLAFHPLAALNNECHEMEIKNRLNQEAVSHLIDEMSGFSNGDFTVTTTVTEDMTGAVAAAVNNTVDVLRSLIERVNTAMIQVSSAAQESQATAMYLTDTCEHQTHQIIEVSSTMHDLAQSVEQISSGTTQSADIAKHSVHIVAQGRNVIEHALAGIGTLQEHIQDTSIRINRLGENAQEIGSITELIDDIAEQTNTLSISAAIQATMAGTAGQGFSVVADEMQRLAERSSNASKHISTLVKTTQNEIAEAITSMSTCAYSIISGAESSQNVSAELEKIEAVSLQLSELINNISDTAKQHVDIATSTSDSMNIIQEISIQTSTGTNESMASIERLLNLTDDLRKSVSSFTLPS